MEEAPEGCFTARALGQSIFTEADTVEVLKDNIRYAVPCHFENGDGPMIIGLHHVREEILTV